MHLLYLLLISALLLSAQPPSAQPPGRPAPTSGSLSGAILGPAKGETLAGIWVTLNRLPQRGETGFASVSRRVLTGKDGTYSFPGLPLGRYEVCPQLGESLYLNPCEWPDTPAARLADLGPLATLTAARPDERLDIQLQAGVILNFRLEDTARRLDAQALSRNEKSPYVGVVLADGKRRPAQPLYGRNGLFVYTILVPAGQPVRPVIEAGGVDLEDTARQRLPQGLANALTLAPGSPPVEVVFRVVAGGRL